MKAPPPKEETSHGAVAAAACAALAGLAVLLLALAHYLDQVPGWYWRWTAWLPELG